MLRNAIPETEEGTSELYLRFTLGQMLGEWNSGRILPPTGIFSLELCLPIPIPVVSVIPKHLDLNL